MALIRFVIFLLAFASSLAADDAIPDSATVVRFDFARWCQVGDHTFSLESTTLANVIDALGSGTIRRVGNEGVADPTWVVDYTDGHRLIRFYSDNDMGGTEHYLGGLEIIPPATGDSFSDLPLLSSAITFSFGSADIALPGLVSALGPAVKTNGIEWYRYSGKKRAADSSGKERDVDVLATLRVQVVDGKVTALQIGHVSSY
jgi:hypothetical protein